MVRVFAAIWVVLAGLVSLGVGRAEAGFRTPESLVRNVYAYYGDRSSSLSNGLPRDAAALLLGAVLVLATKSARDQR